LQPLLSAIAAIDRFGRGAGERFGRRRAGAMRQPGMSPGISVLIPERENPAELASCLAGLEQAVGRWREPVEAVVVVNGAPPAPYRELQAAHPWIAWQFHPRPLGFSGAIAAGLRQARYDWVYLLNSDAVLDSDSLAEAARLRDPMTFSIASQIFLKDPTRFRDETNWTRLLVEDGLVTAHDMIPESEAAVEHFYAGGGASLFQTALLRGLVDARLYFPFYWEDVEWGWRARKMGYRSFFCARSRARHTRAATIARNYAAAEIEAVVARNRLLFQLRNWTSAGSLDAVAAAISRAPREVAEFFVDWRTVAAVVRGRLWNHFAPVADSELLAPRPFSPL
jgi:GT2 family glycosyltransferase